MTESPVSDDAPAFLTTGQFAQRASLSQATVKRLCDSGRLAHVVLSCRGDRRIPSSELDRLLAEAAAKRLHS
jgi:excisionase family DNA binding protein